PLQVIPQEYTEDREDENAQPGREVGAVDGGEELCTDDTRGACVGAVLPLAPEYPQGQAILHRQQRAGEEDEKRDDAVEELRRAGEQQDRANQGPNDRGDPQDDEAVTLSPQLRPV